jgi:cytochrome c-type biogenesis protein CcmH
MTLFIVAAVLLSLLAMSFIVRISRAAPVAIVALAVLLYLQLGTPAAFDEPLMTALQADAMVARLAKHMQTDPTNAKGWLLLARSQGLLGRDKEAAQAYQRLIALGQAEPAAMDEYAALVARQKSGRLD